MCKSPEEQADELADDRFRDMLRRVQMIRYEDEDDALTLPIDYRTPTLRESKV